MLPWLFRRRATTSDDGEQRRGDLRVKRERERDRTRRPEEEEDRPESPSSGDGVCCEKKLRKKL